MKKHKKSLYPEALEQLCKIIRSLVSEGDYESSVKEICTLMERYPDAPQPHNLFGIVLEKKGDHGTAMKHFRAAIALDPAYTPAQHNLKTYGTFFSGGKCAFDESDVPADVPAKIEVIYDERGIGWIKKKI